LHMADDVIAKTGFPAGLDREGLVQAFTAHNDAVKETIPAKQLLLFEVKDGWEPLCNFLGVPVPTETFPRTNHREEFWDRVEGKI
ncbi:MAG: sulfotransferase, partial [Gimesia chilikensis]